MGMVDLWCGVVQPCLGFFFFFNLFWLLIRPSPAFQVLPMDAQADGKIFNWGLDGLRWLSEETCNLVFKLWSRHLWKCLPDFICLHLNPTLQCIFINRCM